MRISCLFKLHKVGYIKILYNYIIKQPSVNSFWSKAFVVSVALWIEYVTEISLQYDERHKNTDLKRLTIDSQRTRRPIVGGKQFIFVNSHVYSCRPVECSTVIYV